jgi:hypothetical protein
MFLMKFIPMGNLRGRILNFQHNSMESIPEARERLHKYILAYPHHRMESWLIL